VYVFCILISRVPLKNYYRNNLGHPLVFQYRRSVQRSWKAGSGGRTAKIVSCLGLVLLIEELTVNCRI
jgi:hypothetical protein